MPEKSATPLIHYRRAGGMAGLDQRLTILEDGRAVLDDRKSRSRSQVQATDAELANLQSLIDEVPGPRWHGPLTTIRQALLPRPHDFLRFEVRGARGRITGAAGRADADLAPLVAGLDELLARAVRERRGD
ncbi:MAG: hypothetical protein ABI726_10430 [bacterium]